MDGDSSHEFGRNTASLVLRDLIFRGSGFVILAVMSRTLATEQIGSYFFVISLAEAFSVIAGMSLAPVVMRRLATEPGHAASHIAGYLGLRLVTALPYVACVFAAASFFPGLPVALVLTVACFVLLQNSFVTIGSAFVALGRPYDPLVIGASVQAVFLGLFVGAMALWPSLDVVVGTHTLRALALVGLALAFLGRFVRPLRVRWDASLVHEGVPFMALAVLNIVRARSDTVFLGALADFSDVGYYSLATRVVDAAVFVPLSFGWGLLPQLAERGLTRDNRRAFFRGLAILLALGVVGTVFLWGAANPLARLLYGPMAIPAAQILRLLAPLVPLAFAQMYLSQVLHALHREKQSLLATALASVALLASYFVLVPGFGPLGTAVARILASALQVILLAFFLRVAFRAEPDSSRASGLRR